MAGFGKSVFIAPIVSPTQKSPGSSETGKVAPGLSGPCVFVHAINKYIPQQLCQTFEGYLQGKKDSNLGFKVSRTLVVAKVERDSVAEQVLQFGDLITHVDNRAISDRDTLFKELDVIRIKDFKVKVKGIRLVTKLPMTTQRFPKLYDRSVGYKYHVALLYMLPGCKLSLCIKSFNSKVLVTRVLDNSLASMSLSIGDCILDVDMQPVGSVLDASAAIGDQIQKSGYVTLAVEQAEHQLAVQHVRAALLAEKEFEVDLPLAPDVLDICKLECKRFLSNVDMEPEKSILRDGKAPTRNPASHINVSEKAMDFPIAAEHNPQLLMRVPELQRGQ